jgi:hypothetical protein
MLIACWSDDIEITGAEDGCAQASPKGCGNTSASKKTPDATESHF